VLRACVCREMSNISRQPYYEKSNNLSNVTMMKMIIIRIIIIITARIRVYFECLTDVQIFKGSPLMKTEIT
jgi:hypothetical protein